MKYEYVEDKFDHNLRVECCGCAVVIQAGDKPEPVSHGICEKCYYVMVGKIRSR